MSAKPFGVFAMGEYARRAAFPQSVVANLLEVAEVPLDLLVTDFAAATAEAALDRAEFVITGWDAPQLNSEALRRMPRLRLNAHAAGSVKPHTTASVWRAGVAVSSAAAANAEPVAEYTRATVLLACKRAFRRAADYAANGDNGRVADSGYIGRTIGLVGASRTGRRVLELLRGYDFRLLVADPYVSGEDIAALGARKVELDELCRNSDVVSVHAPQLPHTRHLIDDRRLALMRDGAVVINTARGSLIDTSALAEHCRSGRLDAVLDVTDPEPLPVGHPLLGLPNVWVTPHLAGAEGSEIALLGEFAVAEIRRFFAGVSLHGQVFENELPTLA